VVQVVAGQGLSSEEANLSVGLLGAALDHVLPWRVCLGLALSAKLIGPEWYVSRLKSPRDECNATEVITYRNSKWVTLGWHRLCVRV
jgi:hypothetical protein